MFTNAIFVVYATISNLLNDVREFVRCRRSFEGIENEEKTSTSSLLSFQTFHFFSYVRRRSVSPVRQLVSSSSSGSDESLQKIRENTLIDRFNELYSHERLNAMDTLRTVSDDYEMNQRICFNIMQVITNKIISS